MAGLSLQRLVKRYGSDPRTPPVVRGVDIEIGDGEFVALVGPSGCGKSTLLRMIAGLESVTEGEIRLGGRSITDAAPRERDVAMVFQNYALYPHMTVGQNLGFALKLQGLGKREIALRVDRAAQVLGLDELLQRRPKQLSGGQRQRVAMGRAIVRQPQAFLFDEPLSNLDAKLRVQMRTEIRALHQRLGTTTVYVTHDQIEAMTMADRIVVLRDGAVEQIGAPLELYDHPVNAFVASFIGSPSMNFIPGRLRLDGAPCIVTDDGLALPLAGAPRGGIAGQPVFYGQRPEHFTLDGEAGGSLPAEVTVVEPTGSETQIVVQSGGRELIVLSRERVGARPGDRLSLRPQSATAHVFDRESGARLN